MLKKKNPKQPSDYETLRVRVPPEVELQRIMKKVEKVRAHLNKKKSEERKLWMGNHVILEAIQIGLDLLINKSDNPQTSTKRK